MHSPIVSAMLQAGSESLSELRQDVEVVGYGPILNDAGTVAYRFRGVLWYAPEPTEYCWAAMSLEQQVTWCLRAHLDRKSQPA